jgi:hypothetical protein
VNAASRQAKEHARQQVSVLGHGDLYTSLILIFPLFLAYEIGVVFSSSVNGVDFVTRSVFAAVGYDRGDYLLVQLVLVAGYLALVAHARRRGALPLGVIVPMLLESAIYALTLGSFIILIMQDLLGLAMDAGPVLALGDSGEALIIALGAGVHEEVVFRLGLMAGVAAVLRQTGMYHRWAVPLALVGSALVFSLAHHLGPHGEAFFIDVFIYRALAGAAFGLIFYYHSLAHAVYTHFLYDVYVLMLRP